MYYQYEDDDMPSVIYLPQDDTTEDEFFDERVWTTKRIVYLLIALILIAAMVFAYFLLPLLQANGLQITPPPTPMPDPQWIA
jgi:hypothetical protein